MTEIGMSPSRALYLLGSGTFSFFDITLLTQKILRECRTVFYLHDLPTLDRYLADITPNPINLMPIYYIDGEDRGDIYEKIVEHVIEGARKQPPVAFLMHGHPLVYSTISTRILEECASEGMEVEVIPALSSLDRMFVDLEIDITERGLQVFPASTAVRSGIPLNPAVDCFLFQIGALFNDLATRSQTSSPSEVSPLRAYLERFYPPEHVVKIVESAVELGFESRITPIELRRLEDAADVMNYTSSLYIPGLAGSILSVA